MNHQHPTHRKTTMGLYLIHTSKTASFETARLKIPEDVSTSANLMWPSLTGMVLIMIPFFQLPPG